MMSIDTQRLMKHKDIILDTLRVKGPCLPVHVARAAHVSMLFASAFLSELYAEQRIHISNLKVGSSPLYYIQGQEVQLENFIQYLNAKEKEAFHLLKKEKLLRDEQQEPAIRVALREIKDFAILLKITLNNTPLLFWKYYQLSDTDAETLIEQMLFPELKKEQQTLALPSTPTQTILPSLSSTETQETEKEKTQKLQESLTVQIKQQKAPRKPRTEKKKTLSAAELKFVNNVKEYLTTKKIELLEIKEEKKNSFVATVRIDMLFGKQEYYLVVKDKKRLTEHDLSLAFQKAQLERMPLLLMNPGDLDKKALEHLKDWKHLVKIEKLKF